MANAHTQRLLRYWCRCPTSNQCTPASSTSMLPRDNDGHKHVYLDRTAVLWITTADPTKQLQSNQLNMRWLPCCGTQSKLREKQREALLVVKAVHNLKCGSHTHHPTIYVKASAGVICFATQMLSRRATAAVMTNSTTCRMLEPRQ